MTEITNREKEYAQRSADRRGTPMVLCEVLPGAFGVYREETAEERGWEVLFTAYPKN